MKYKIYKKLYNKYYEIDIETQETNHLAEEEPCIICNNQKLFHNYDGSFPIFTIRRNIERIESNKKVYKKLKNIIMKEKRIKGPVCPYCSEI